MRRLEADVVVIGGGATGASVFRDCCLRGMHTILVERGDIASGTTGRNHGLLHSGARYAVTDGHSARECIEENRTLKKIAGHCVEETDGLFISLPEDGLDFQKQFVDGCASAGIETQVLTPEEAIRLEPSVNPDLIGAVRIPDGTIDPFRLTSASILDAREHGGTLLNYTKAVGLIIRLGYVQGVRCCDMRTGEMFEIYSRQVINASGAWCHEVMEYADLSVDMYHSRGALLIMGYRMNSMVINRCRKPGDADILVPGDTVSVIGTTSTHVEKDQLDNLEVTEDEVRVLLAEGSKLAPSMMDTRILRAYCGVRPLVSETNSSGGRSISRGLVAIDHAEKDALNGLITITGGKLMTCRLMAEVATDMAARHLGVTKPCETAKRALPGANLPEAMGRKTREARKTGYSLPGSSIPNSVAGSAVYRHGDRARNFMKEDSNWNNAVVCECEVVTRGEILYAIDKLNARTLSDLRRRTRVGMGPCQGEMCACRVAGLLASSREDGEVVLDSLHDFVDERWKGVRPILWGDALREAEFSYWVQEGLLGLSSLQKDEAKPLLEIQEPESEETQCEQEAKQTAQKDTHHEA
ncbi:anaerobic glycerol-3-phosphate dehydrogenase subunit A [Sansalvadorimonas sp. 2012CJ34-2]|uniref:glycerol-3-phosphate dehydrogenase n=1 Tax=Parendozoicomonas callyspongiae TaxID=2942213 RepID=A0ABT0PK72_9GAMM|nr:anaerobic glycerol-3-phosphate dehydrogenase subunit A [Sansalvadorimonas sp. 2012CJ34-2]MCL6271671.1 anaerobic glycerol-3-phosphate dehydrogenase subunit A [Sansalvadorimonas sp. 2012CJ34-2]